MATQRGVGERKEGWGGWREGGRCWSLKGRRKRRNRIELKLTSSISTIGLAETLEVVCRVLLGSASPSAHVYRLASIRTRNPVFGRKRRKREKGDGWQKRERKTVASRRAKTEHVFIASSVKEAKQGSAAPSSSLLRLARGTATRQERERLGRDETRRDETRERKRRKTHLSFNQRFNLLLDHLGFGRERSSTVQSRINQKVSSK